MKKIYILFILTVTVAPVSSQTLKPHTMLLEEYNVDSWDSLSRTMYSYTQNQLFSEISSDYDKFTNNWDLKIKKEHIRDNIGNDEIVNYFNWNQLSIGWDSSSRFIYTWKDSINIETYAFQYYSAGWNNRILDSNKYNSQNRIAIKYSFLWDVSTLKYEIANKTIYTYNSYGLNDSTMKLSYDSGAATWDTISLLIKTYNSNGNNDSLITYNYSSGNGFLKASLRYHYYTNFDEDSVRIYSTFNHGINKWITNYKSEYEYRSDNLLFRITASNWYPQLNEFIYTFQQTFLYPEISSIENYVNEIVSLPFPNPADNTIQLDFKKNVQNLNVKIYNSLGMEIHNKIFNGQIFKCDISKLKSGIYFISIEHPNASQSYSFIKN